MTALLDIINAGSYNPQRVDNWLRSEYVFYPRFAKGFDILLLFKFKDEEQ